MKLIRFENILRKIQKKEEIDFFLSEQQENEQIDPTGKMENGVFI